MFIFSHVVFQSDREKSGDEAVMSLLTTREKVKRSSRRRPKTAPSQLLTPTELGYDEQTGRLFYNVRPFCFLSSCHPDHVFHQQNTYIFQRVFHRAINFAGTISWSPVSHSLGISRLLCAVCKSIFTDCRDISTLYYINHLN